MLPKGLVIVYNLHFLRPLLRPDEAKPPLVIDPNGMSAGSISTQRFQTITRWAPQIIQDAGSIKHEQLTPRLPLDGAETSRTLPPEQGLCLTTAKGLDHGFGAQSVRDMLNYLLRNT